MKSIDEHIAKDESEILCSKGQWGDRANEIMTMWESANENMMAALAGPGGRRKRED